MKLKNGSQFGDWKIVSDTPIGVGGNSQVWKVRNGDLVAIMKFLLNWDRYERFKSEVEFQHKHSSEQGILPLLDYYLPESPSKDDRPWLVTPVATMLRDDVEKSEDVVKSTVKRIIEIAQVLLRMHLENCAHRDIKPENLFIYDDRGVLGDFGLVSYPNKKDLTCTGERIGAFYYVAPELAGNDFDSTDPRPGDVYALAKTMFVLITGLAFPLPGHLNRNEKLLRLSTYVQHPRLSTLEALLDQSTRTDPTVRINTPRFLDELEAWQKNDAGFSIQSLNALLSVEQLSDFERSIFAARERDQQAKDNKIKFAELTKKVYATIKALETELIQCFQHEYNQSNQPGNWSYLALSKSGKRCIIRNGLHLNDRVFHAELVGNLYIEILDAGPRTERLIHNFTFEIAFDSDADLQKINRKIEELRSEHLPKAMNMFCKIIDS